MRGLAASKFFRPVGESAGIRTVAAAQHVAVDDVDEIGIAHAA